MKSALIFVSSFLLVAAVHGSALLETRADNKVEAKNKGNDPQNPQGGNGTFLINSNCSAPLPVTESSSGIPVTPATNQSSDSAPPSQGPPKCFNLTALDPSGGQPSVTVQLNQTSSDQTASPNGDNNGSLSDPHFQFCPAQDGTTPPFTNGTMVNFQEVPCPCLNNGTSPSGGENGKPDN